MFRSESIEQLNKSSVIVTTDAWKEQSVISEPINLFFEDNFEGHKEEKKPTFEPLSDSAEYLAILQRRLAKLQNPKVVEQLRDKRDQCMRELLEGATTTGLLTDSQIELEATCQSDNQTANEIIRFIKPEQPLTAGEVVPIIKHDQLERSTGLEETDKSDSEVEK